MSQAVGTDVDIRDIVLSNNSFGPAEIQRLAKAISRDFTQFAVLRDAVGELESREERTPAAAVRLGVCYYLLGPVPSAPLPRCRPPMAEPWLNSTWANRNSLKATFNRPSNAITRRR